MKLFKLIVASAFFPAFVQAQSIKLNLSKGATYEVITNTKVTSSASVMGQDMESNIDNNTIESVQVKDTRPNETDLVSTVTKLVVNMQMMGQEVSYDSDKKDNEGAATETFDKMKNRVKNITVDANGKVIKEDKNDEEAAMGAMGITVATNLPFFNSSFTGRDAKPGASWLDSLKTTSQKLNTTTSGTYTVKSVTGETAVILFEGVQTSSGVVEQMGMEMNMTSSSKVTSQFEVDINTGLVKKSSVTSDGTSNVEAMGMSIPVTMKSTITSSARLL